MHIQQCNIQLIYQHLYQRLKYFVTKMQNQNQTTNKYSKIDSFVCILGNDGSGKSSISHFLNQLLVSQSDSRISSRNSFCVERSLMRLDNLQKQTYYKVLQEYSDPVHELIKIIKEFDKLTYSYTFEADWYKLKIPKQISFEGRTIPVYWFFIEAPSNILKTRIQRRTEMSVYEYYKCVEYFNVVYKQMCYFYGIPQIPNYNRQISKTIKQILEYVNKDISIAKFPALNSLTPPMILQKQLITKIQQNIVKNWAQIQRNEFYKQKILPSIKQSKTFQFYGEFFDKIQEKLQLTIIAKWIKQNSPRIYLNDGISIKVDDKQILIELNSAQFLFEEVIQGQSKLVYRLISNCPEIMKSYQDKIFILLKGTIYSHTKQCTGEIKQLPEIRAKGSMIFLQMLKRNRISHSYICINHSGVILSKFVKTNNLEIVFKKQLLGTDKHSYLGLNNVSLICDKKSDSVEYHGGIYIRFDWRNPNHILLNNTDLWLNSDPYYYIVEKYLGKQNFFNKFLTNKQKCKPIGDKCISQDIVSEYINTDLVKKLIIEAYCTFQYYAHQVGLEILDGCFMVDEKCDTIWSQINPDCLRVKSLPQLDKNYKREDYDKDIWRLGGSSSKDIIIKKWKLFNDIFCEYFSKNRFMDVEVTQQRFYKQIYAKKIIETSSIRPTYRKYYQQIVRGSTQRQVIGTIDLINGQPILVQESIFKQNHSEGNLKEAWDYIKIMPQIVIVDIDGASGNQSINTHLITQLSRKKPNNIYAIGGGIRDSQIAQHFLSCVGNIIISSNLDLIEKYSIEIRKKIIVQLSVNQKNEVLTHARTVNTKWDVISKIIQLCALQIKKVSITFRNSQGKLEGLPREQLRDIMFRMPGPIQKVIIAGGISSIQDLQFIWGFEKCVPQLGSAIWKKKIDIGEIYSKIVRYDRDGLVNTIIKSVNDKVLGLVHLNQEAILRTCSQRILYRYSRQHKQLMKKGESSGNIQHVQSINIDCDNDCLMITVSPQGQGNFCHQNVPSCFYQSSIESNRRDIVSLQQHIKESKKPGVGSGYSFKYQNKPQLAIQKIQEEVEQLSLAENTELQLQESTDVLAHLLMFWNSQNININDVIGIMNQRSQKKIVRTQYHQKIVKSDPKKNIIKIAIGLGKHTKYIHTFMHSQLGIELIQNKQKERCYKIGYKIINEEKAEKALGIKITPEIQIVLVSTKPKDMVKMMNKKFIDFGINYSNMISLYENDVQIIQNQAIQNLKLAIIKRKGENVKPNEWNKNNKGLIASQYPFEIVKYFTNMGISSDKYTLLKVTGHSESYLSDYRFDYCDAIVCSGRTIEENNLEVESILLSQIGVVLFKI